MFERALFGEVQLTKESVLCGFSFYPKPETKKVKFYPDKNTSSCLGIPKVLDPFFYELDLRISCISIV
jgi:hypothetical protein